MERYPLEPTGARGRKIVWKITNEGCRVPTSHLLNHDGYFRKRINKQYKMVHILIYEQIHGPVPLGKEVHHKCRNRACCTETHLTLKDKGHHVGQHNTLRSVAKLRDAREYWLTKKCTGTALGIKFCISISSACRWIRRWKQDATNL